MCTVSVIIPTYNREKQVVRAIGSVLAQTYTSYEIIVVDDGSADGTREVIKSYGDKVKYFFQENAGPGVARNTGIRNSKSEFVAFLDSDDEWMPNFLERSVCVLRDNPQCAASTSSLFRGRERRSTACFRERIGLREGVWELSLDISDNDLSNILDSHYLFAVGTVLCRMSVLEKLGGFYSEQRCYCGEDLYLWIQVLLSSKIYIIMDPLMWYHTEEDGLAADGYTRWPPEPYFTQAADIRKNCPPRNRDLLERWLALQALRSSHMRLTINKLDDVLFLMQTFPLMKRWRWSYAKLRIKYAVPGLGSLILRIKRSLFATT